MAGFDAGSVVEPLDYKFEAFVPGCNGTIREPTDKQIAAYLAGIQKLVRDFRGLLPDEMLAGAGGDIAAMLTAVEELDTDIAVKFSTGMAGLAADLCSGQPSKADILKLPPRIRAPFLAWLQQEVMSPEVAPGGGKAQVRTLRPAAAG